MVFIEAVAFTKRLERLAGESAGEVLSAIQEELLAESERGDMVQGTGGIRKARVANPARGKGKRGGFRYLYLYLEHAGQIHLLYLLDKNEQSDLSAEQRKVLAALARSLKE